MMRPLEELNAQIFREQLNTKFMAGTLELELVAVEEQDRPGMELFSLHFAGPFEPRLRQQTHQLKHEKLGEFEILMTPISASPQQGTVYESIFHRFRR